MAMQTSYNWGNSTKQGPWGGQGGAEWDYKPNGAITEITIGHGWFIDSISFKSVDNKGTVEGSSKFGGDGGAIVKISFDWPREYLTSISGTYGDHQTSYAIQSLCFQTNKTTYRPFGRTDGSTFNFPMKDGIIVGFYGRGSTLVDAIGIYVKPHADLFCPSSRFQILGEERDVQPAHFLLRMETYSLTDGPGKKYESDSFEVGGYKWKLILFPKGDNTCNGKNHISLYLGIQESNFTCGSVVADVKFFVLNQSTKKYLTIGDPKGGLTYFDKLRSEEGVSNLLSLERFKNPSNGYLVNDCCAFGVEILVVQPSQTYTLLKDPVGRIWTYQMKSFSSYAGKDFWYTIYVGAGRRWELIMFYPKVDGSLKDKFLSVHLKLVPPITTKAYVRAKVQVMNHRGDKKMERTISGWFADGSEVKLGYPKFMPLSELLESSNEYLTDDIFLPGMEFDVVSV